jgi:hypothetical protein
MAAHLELPEFRLCSDAEMLVSITRGEIIVR